MSGGEVRRALEAGVDFVLIGRGAILHDVYVCQVAADLEFEPIARPVAPGHREAEGFSDCFIGYMKNWKVFVSA